MNATIIEGRLRRFLVILVALLCLGTTAELWLSKHTKDVIQVIPFVLCVVGFISVVAVLIRPKRSTILALRVVMIALVLGSLFGVYEHLTSNVDFETEMRPSAQ